MKLTNGSEFLTKHHMQQKILNRIKTWTELFSVRLMQEENSFQIIPVLTKLEIFDFVTQQI